MFQERASCPAEIDAFHLKRYEFATRFVVGKRVLDAACGIGYGSAMLKEAGATYVLGVDIAAEAVQTAEDLYVTPGVEFRRMSCLVVDGCYDVVVSLETIEHLADGPAWCRRIASLLASDGVAVISTPIRKPGKTIDEPPANPYHIREWTADEFRHLLLESFREVDLFFQSLLLPELPGPRWIRLWSRLISGFVARRQAVHGDRTVLSMDEWFGKYGYRPCYMVAVCEGPLGSETEEGRGATRRTQ
jgi:SAM-dependent methyltransferase